MSERVVGREPSVVTRHLHLLLRVGVAACFIGHGAFGVLRKEEWLPFFAIAGIEADLALSLMPVIGIVDIAIGIAALLYPCRAVFLHAAVWGLWTAALRPLAGSGVWEMVERAGNYGVPIAMLALVGMKGGVRGLLVRIPAGAGTATGFARAFGILQWTTALLLIGHGALALAGKALLASHMAAIGLSPAALPWVGVIDLGLAAAILIRPHAIVFGSIVFWKVGTEALFVLAGSPIWEFIERGGSYVAPLCGAILLSGTALARAGAPSRPRSAVTAALVLALVGVGFSTSG